MRLAFSGLIFSFIFMILNDQRRLLEKGFFNGYNSYLGWALFIQGFGGMLVGLVIKYADNILKSFANSVSIILTYFISYLVFGSLLSPTVIFGSSLVIMSVFLYSVEISIPAF